MGSASSRGSVASSPDLSDVEQPRPMRMPPPVLEPPPSPPKREPLSYYEPMYRPILSSPFENWLPSLAVHARRGEESSGASKQEDGKPMPWMNDVRERLAKSSPNLNTSNTNSLPTIFVVPPNIRKLDPSAYTPQLISIGPYYHHPTFIHNNETSYRLQHYKNVCTRLLLSRISHGEDEARKLLYECLAKMRGLISDIRSCYSQQIFWLEDEELAELMLLDGCFILRYLLESRLHPKGFIISLQQQQQQQMRKDKAPVVDDGGRGSIFITTDGEEFGADFGTQGALLGMLGIWDLVDYDLLKLENQIPFFVLKELFGLLKTTEESSVNLIDLALEHFRHIQPTPKSKSLEAQSEYAHLLHLFYSSLLPSSPVDYSRSGINIDPKSASHRVPCATELGRAGVRFKENKQASCFLDISFVDGVLKIPFLHISDSTNSLFRNLIAFEQCYPHTLTLITTYAIFVDCLVDTAQDVSLLHLNGILLNGLGTDEACADLFNKLTNQIHYALNRNYLRDIFVAVNKYRQSNWHMYRAGLMRDYCNPWAIISVIAATVLLVLTTLQTFYTVYAYHFPKESG